MSNRGVQPAKAGDSVAARFTGLALDFYFANLGLAPQALCCHLLRRFRAQHV